MTTFQLELNKPNLVLICLVSYLTIPMFFKDLLFYNNKTNLSDFVYWSAVQPLKYAVYVAVRQSVGFLTCLWKFAQIRNFASKFSLQHKRCVYNALSFSSWTSPNEHSVIDVVLIPKAESVKYLGPVVHTSFGSALHNFYCARRIYRLSLKTRSMRQLGAKWTISTLSIHHYVLHLVRYFLPVIFPGLLKEHLH